MAIIEAWLPPSREHWELLTWGFQLFPLFTGIQWVTDWFPQGRTSINSSLNIPGKIGWASMEVWGFTVLLYIMFTLPTKLGLESLPRANWLLAGLFTFHYINRAILTPFFFNPTMSPIHPVVWLSATAFQVVNGICIGAWLAGYGPTTAEDWAGAMPRIQLGVVVFLLGWYGNYWHDSELRRLRRLGIREQQERARREKKPVGSVEKVYQLPEEGLFKYILFPQYTCEWIEWVGFWIIAGVACVPARNFVQNEIVSMAPRARGGLRWYIQKFGSERVGARKAVIPGVF